MAETNLTLSLVANFDDLVRRLIPYNTELTDFSIEMVKLIDTLNEQLNYAQNEVKEYKERCNLLELENHKLSANLKNTKEAYKKEVAMRASVCRDHEGLSKINEINFSSELLSDDDFDKSEDDIDEPMKDKRGEIRFTSNKNLLAAEENRKQTEIKFASNQNLTPIQENISKPTLLPGSQSKSRIENRSHSFAPKKLFRSNETCTVCNSKFGFYASYFRCADCRACVHGACKTKLPTPCIPYTTSNQIGKKGRLLTIADFVNPNSRPCIPGIIIHCCREIERRGLNEPGLYRIPGSDSEVKALVEKFLRSKGGVPVISHIDVHVLCGVIRNFLNRLDDPLITRVLWSDFVNAAKMENSEDRRPYLIQAVSDLPIPNRHSLAYLILHLKRVMSSPYCNMPISNIAKVLGPTIVGYSSNAEILTVSVYSETSAQIKTLEALLNLPSDFWSELISDPVSEQPKPAPLVEAVNRRQSIGSRVVGGSLQSQVLNPWTSNRRQKKRPLF